MKDFALHSTLKVRGKEYEIINITQYCLPNKNNTLLKQYHLMSGGDLKDLFFDDAENIYILCDNVKFVTSEMPSSKWKRISDDIADIVSSSSETHEKHARFVMFKKDLKYRLLEYHDHEVFYRNADLVLPNYVQLTQNDISQKNQNFNNRTIRHFLLFFIIILLGPPILFLVLFLSLKNLSW